MYTAYRPQILSIPLDMLLTGDQEVMGSGSGNWVRQHYFVEIDHEVFSVVILSLPRLIMKYFLWSFSPFL